MITTLILGAGASAAYEYPTGAQLLTQVKEVLKKEKTGPYVQILNGLEHIGIESLDAYMNLDSNAGPVLKEIISEIIHSYEDESKFNLPVDESPYANIISAIPTENYDKFRIISFNYDRSLEFYLARGIATMKRCNAQEAFTILSKLKIIHVHGRLCNLPGEKGYENPHAREPFHYGYFNRVKRQLRDRGNSIPYTEADLLSPITIHAKQSLKNCYENSKVFESALTALEESNRVCFLGFGFHATNMTTLGYPFNNTGDSAKKVFGTTWKMTRNEFRRVCR